MQDILIFPTFIEQVGTREIIHSTFTHAHWQDIRDEPDAFVSGIEIDIAPLVFFEWAVQVPHGGVYPVLIYCLNLGTQYIIDPPDWMTNAITRLRFRLTNGV